MAEVVIGLYFMVYGLTYFFSEFQSQNKYANEIAGREVWGIVFIFISLVILIGAAFITRKTIYRAGLVFAGGIAGAWASGFIFSFISSGKWYPAGLAAATWVCIGLLCAALSRRVDILEMENFIKSFQERWNP